MNDLSGRLAVVTGAGSGIGRELALCCAGRGMRLVLADVDDAGLAATAALLNRSDTLTVWTDVSRSQDVQALADLAFRAAPDVALLFNNAGVAAGGRAWESTPEDWAWVLGVNLMGVVHGIQSFVPRMLAQGRSGHIVNTASAAGLISVPGASVYCASKHAVVTLSECLSQELRSKQAAIGVSVLCPSYVQTGIVDSERHRPQKLRRRDNVPPASSEKLMRGMRSATLTAADVAEFAVEGVLRGSFYLVPHEAVLPDVLDRAQRIAAGLPPGEGRLPEGN